MQAVGSSRKVFELIDRQPEVFNDGRIAPDGRNAKIEGRIEFRNVRFCYPTRPNVTVLNVLFKFTDFLLKLPKFHRTSPSRLNPAKWLPLLGPAGAAKVPALG